jgi:flagellar assembly protein FliH
LPRIIKSIDISDAPIVCIAVPAPAYEEQEVLLVGPVESIDEEIDPVAVQKAQELLATAQEEAAACLAAATQTAQMQCEEAHKQGHAQGYEEGQREGFENGYKEGIDAAAQEMQTKLQSAIAKAEQILSIAEQQAKDIVVGAERQIIDISMAMVSKILAREVEENPMVVLPIVTAALKKVRDQEQIEIRINPEEYHLLLQARKDLQMVLGREQALQIVADQTIAAGGCIIDTAYGSVDARIDTQFDTLRKALAEIIP